MKLHQWLVCATLLVAALSRAQSVQPKLSDFAMQLPLTVSGANGVVQLRLPLRLYQESRSPDLADVRVFNAAGQPLPFALLTEQQNERVRWRESTARLFPIYGTSPMSAQSRLDVRIAADGALLSVRSGPAVAAGAALNTLILDLGAAGADETLDSLQLLRSENTTYRAELAIDRSDDMRWWDRVAQSHVDWLQGTQPNESLINDRITIGARGSRYLRVQWLEGPPELFQSIIARWRSVEATEAQPLEVKLQPTAGPIAGDWVYSTSPSIAATQVGLELPTANLVLPASIGYYQRLYSGQRVQSTEPETFLPVAQGTFYRLTQAGNERISSNIQIAPWSSSRWVVRPSEVSDIKPPLLVLRWYPQSLVFTARGAGDTEQERRRFILAVGAAPAQTQKWGSQRVPIERVAPGFTAAELASAEKAALGEWQHAGTRLAPVTSAKSASWQPQRSLILWFVLIVGALALAGMTWRLYKQMQSGPP